MSDRAPDAKALTALLDKQEITELLTRYLRSVDRGDVATLRACYLPGATEDHGGLFEGPAADYADSIAGARMIDRLERRDGAWGIAHRRPAGDGGRQHASGSFGRVTVPGGTHPARSDHRFCRTRRHVLPSWPGRSLCRSML
jgi:hypothetical protein